ncbi:hypothetical protein FI667_g13416, partial [Globisporangium splendens]
MSFGFPSLKQFRHIRKKVDEWRRWEEELEGLPSKKRELVRQVLMVARADNRAKPNYDEHLYEAYKKGLTRILNGEEITDVTDRNQSNVLPPTLDSFVSRIGGLSTDRSTAVPASTASAPASPVRVTSSPPATTAPTTSAPESLANEGSINDNSYDYSSAPASPVRVVSPASPVRVASPASPAPASESATAPQMERDNVFVARLVSNVFSSTDTSIELQTQATHDAASSSSSPASPAPAALAAKRKAPIAALKALAAKRAQKTKRKAPTAALKALAAKREAAAPAASALEVVIDEAAIEAVVNSGETLTPKRVARKRKVIQVQVRRDRVNTRSTKPRLSSTD